MSTNDPSPLDIAAYNLEQAKKAEQIARDNRLRAECAVIELVGVKEDGTKSAKGSYYKLTTTLAMNRKLKSDFFEILDDLPADIFKAVIKTKHELSVSDYKKLAVSNPEAYRKVAEAVIATPSKIAVKVEELKQKQEQEAA
jgi:hypothetical protein